MQLAPIGVTGPADRRLVAGLREIEPLLEELRPRVLVIGGLMTRLWLHAKPIDVPIRPTADIDLGVDRRGLRLVGDRRVVAPLLDRLGFRVPDPAEPFRHSKMVEGVGEVLVDILVPPGSSRRDPPLVEADFESLAAPGLAYAVLRGPEFAHGRFVEDGDAFEFELPIPPLDAAFVLKAALAASGVRSRPDRVRSDSVDAMTLAAACLTEPASIVALRAHRSRSDVRKGLAWLEDAFRSPTAIGSRRIEGHFLDEGYGPGMGGWAHDVMRQLSARLEPA